MNFVLWFFCMNTNLTILQAVSSRQTTCIYIKLYVTLQVASDSGVERLVTPAICLTNSESPAACRFVYVEVPGL